VNRKSFEVDKDFRERIGDRRRRIGDGRLTLGDGKITVDISLSLSLLNEQCKECKCLDNEEHRMNYCVKYRDINFYDDDVEKKIPFQSIFSENMCTLKLVFGKIGKVWNLKSGHGTMNIA